MKTVNDYTDAAISNLFDEIGAFFAFSKSQFDEGKKEGVQYVNGQMGMIYPKGKGKELYNRMDKIYTDARTLQVKEYGIDRIVIYELYNHETFYTNDIDSAFDALEGYGVTRAQVYAAYLKELPNADN